jgi:hypothetical protein
MKIQVVKQGNVNVKPMSVCPWVVEVPPETPKGQ